MAAAVGRAARGLRRHRRAGERVLPAQHVPVPLGQPAPRGPRAQLHPGRRAVPPRADGRTQGAEPDGLGRLRAARRERRHPERRSPPRVHAGEHRQNEGAAQRAGMSLRLVQGARVLRSGLLPLEPVAVPAHVGARPRVPEDRAGELVPGLPHGARQRAGGRRALRALRRPRRDPRSDAVVLPRDRLRRAAAGRARPPAALVRARQDDAAQLDRALGRRRGPLPHRRADRARPGVHDAPGYALRRDVSRARAGAPRRRSPRGTFRRRPPPRDRGLRRARPEGVAPGAGSRGRREGGPRHRVPGDQSRDGGAHPRVARELRAARLRDGRHHGRPRARPAGLRVRAALQAGGAPGLPKRGGRSRRRRDDGGGAAWRRAVPLGLVGRHAQRSGGDPQGHRVARGEGLRQGQDRLPPARLAHLAAALLGDADPGGPLSRMRRRAGPGRRPAGPPSGGRRVPGRRGQSPREVAGLRPDALPQVRRRRAARDGHDGHVRRLLVVLPAVPEPGRRGAHGRHRARRPLAAGRPVHRGHRARDPAPALCPLRVPGAQGHGASCTWRSPSSGSSIRE